VRRVARGERLAAAAAANAPAATNPNQPPTPVGELLGRQRELALAHELLAGGARLLTFTGPGGVGKTRLALELAAELGGADPDRLVCFADLTPLREPALVPTTIAHAFGLAAWDARVPLDEALEARLHGQRAVLVLDNCEQVLAGARAVGALLEALPELVVVATSREPLRLRVEQELPVPPLPLPYLGYGESLAQLTDNPAVQLFVQWARRVDPGFVLTDANAHPIAELCVRLDGLPLGIELAAARTRLLPAAALLARLEKQLDLLQQRAVDAPARHQTLKAAIAWSYELLSGAEQALFRRLGVFAGGAALEAMEAVADLPSQLVEDLLSALVDKSLVQPIEGSGLTARFRLLDTVRAFALEELAEHGEEPATRRRQALYYVDLAERAEAGILGSEQVYWFARLDPELGNFRAALRWSIDQQDAELALRLGSALMAFWFPRGHFTEARAWGTETLSLPGAPPTSRARITSLARLGGLIAFQGESVRSQELTAEALALARQLGDGRIIGQAAQGVGITALAGGDWPAARAALEEARGRMREAGDWFWEAFAVDYLAVVAAQEGNAAEAQRLLTENLARRRQHGDRWGEAESMERLGLVHLRLGASAEAHAQLSASLRLREALEDALGMTRALGLLATVAAMRGQLERATRLLGAAEALRDRLGAVVLPTERAEHDRTVTLARTTMGEAAFQSAWAAGRLLLLQDVVQAATDTLDAPPTSRPVGPSTTLLSAREREVAALIGQGLTSAEIAERLVITARTADTHADNIRSKLGLRSRTEIASWATAHGLVVHDDRHA